MKGSQIKRAYSVITSHPTYLKLQLESSLHGKKRKKIENEQKEILNKKKSMRESSLSFVICWSCYNNYYYYLIFCPENLVRSLLFAKQYIYASLYVYCSCNELMPWCLHAFQTSHDILQFKIPILNEGLGCHQTADNLCVLKDLSSNLHGQM